MNRLPVVCVVIVFLVLAAPALRAGPITWSDTQQTYWLANAAGIVFDESVPDLPPDVELVGSYLMGRTCTLTAVAGGPDEFDRLAAVPDEGYLDRHRVAGTTIVVAKLSDGRYAKMLVRGASFDPASDNPNARGVQITVVLSR